MRRLCSILAALCLAAPLAYGGGMDSVTFADLWTAGGAVAPPSYAYPTSCWAAYVWTAALPQQEMDTWEDATGNGNTATATGLSRCVATGDGVWFDGTNDYFTIPDLPMNTNMTLVVKWDRLATNSVNLAFGASGATTPLSLMLFSDRFAYYGFTASSGMSGGANTNGWIVDVTTRTATNRTLVRYGVTLADAAQAAVSGTYNTIGRNSTRWNAGHIKGLAVLTNSCTAQELSDLVDYIGGL